MQLGGANGARLRGCRARETPASLRFLGRNVHIAVTVALVAIMCHGATASRVQALMRDIAVDRRTIERWRRWWRDSFTTTPIWQVAWAKLMPPIDQQHRPTSLFERFTGDIPDRLIALLRFIGPITGGRSRAS